MLLQLFGVFAAWAGGRPLPSLRSRKSDWLLALLALRRGGEVDRASLAGLLWPDSDHAQALYNLRRTLAELRDLLGSEAPHLSSPRPHTLALDPAGAEVDVLAFDAAVARGDQASLERAVELYRGPLLEECDQEWILQERLPREEAYLKALESLAAHAAARDDPAAAIRCLRQAVAVDPFRESAQQALLKALMASGDAIGALLAYRSFRLRLRQEIRAEPSPETKALFHQLRAQARGRSGHGVSGSDRLPSTSHSLPPTLSPAPPRRLPGSFSPFVGRETALQAVEACLESARLVTLTGPGGVGKTRLAIEVADAIADDHLDGVWFVDLTRLSEPGLVPQAMASVLDVREQPDRPLTETLAEFLRSKQLLLVLDNCEHLLPACAELVDTLLCRSREIRVLATSRQSLGLAGEVVWPLSGLSVPPGDQGVGDRGRGGADTVTPDTPDPTPDALMQYEAVRLLVERATGATPAFALTERSARSVGEICRRLDGIPLAIELAAARLKALSPEEIAARLDDAFRLLTGGSRTAQPRQQTLRATMDWSYELLSPPERLLLQRLSVFTGGWTLEAAEAVCGEGGDADVLDLLTQLVDKSLVVAEAAPESRYRLLETVRQYARERLRAGATPGGEREEEQVRQRHLEFYLRLVDEAEPYLAGPDQLTWLERLDHERDNLRAALDWALEREPERALCLAAALGSFWIPRGSLEEARQRLAAALERAGQGRHSPAGAAALAHLAYLAFVRDDYPAARAFYEESMALHQERHDRKGIATVLWGLGHVARRQQQYPEARALQEESLAIRRELADPPGVAQSLMGLADTVLEQGDAAAARRYYEEALAIRRALGDRGGVASTLGELANVAWRQGDYEQARQHREESLGLWRALGSRPGVIHALGALGHLARDQGTYEDARAFYTQSLRLRREFGDRYTLIQALEDFAELAAAEGEWARMTRLLGAAESLRAGMGHPLSARERGEYQRLLGGARAALGEKAVSAEEQAGRAMTLQQAIGFALETGAP